MSGQTHIQQKRKVECAEHYKAMEESKSKQPGAELMLTFINFTIVFKAELAY